MKPPLYEPPFTDVGAHRPGPTLRRGKGHAVVPEDSGDQRKRGGVTVVTIPTAPALVRTVVFIESVGGAGTLARVP